MTAQHNLSKIMKVAHKMYSGVSRVGLRGVSKSRKFKWLVKVGASKGVPPDLKKKPCRPMYYCDTMRQTHVQKEWYLFNLPHNNKTNTHVKVTLLCNTHS